MGKAAMWKVSKDFCTTVYCFIFMLISQNVVLKLISNFAGVVLIPDPDDKLLELVTHLLPSQVIDPLKAKDASKQYRCDKTQ